MNDAQTTVLYTLSTLAQTCAALAAFVGAVGLYRLQSLGEHERRLLHDIAALIGHAPTTTDRLLAEARRRAPDHPPLPTLLAELEGAPARLRRSQWSLIAFEAWNLLVIFAALVGFAHVVVLADSPWVLRAIWPVAGMTVVITGYCVYVWTKG